MSKCREEFHNWLARASADSTFRECRQAAWNARGKVDAEICRHPGYIEDQEQYYGNLMAEAIEQENEK